MSTTGALATGALKQLGSFDVECFQSLQDFVNWFYDNTVVQFQTSLITNVVVSPNQPNNSQTNQIWFKQNSSGTIIGVFVFSGGAWIQFLPQPNGIFWCFGDSTDVPDGYLLADSSNPNLTASQATFLQNFWHLDSSGLFYDIFQVTQS